MTCPADELILLDEGGLTEARARQVRDHTQSCQSCAAALAKQHSLVRRLSEGLAGVGPPNVDAVLRRINSTERPRASNLPKRISLGLAALAASAAMAVLWSRQPALDPAEFVARGPASQSWASRVGVTHHLLPLGDRGEGEHAVLDGSIVSVRSGWMTSYRSSALHSARPAIAAPRSRLPSMKSTCSRSPRRSAPIAR